MFDNLIDSDNNKEPKPGMEYVYKLNEIWTVNSLFSKPIKRWSVMINVIKKDNGSYEFTSKETGESFRTNYGWALAENTPENLIRIEEYEKQSIIFGEAERKIREVTDKITTL